MAIEPKKKRSANPVTALSNGLEEDLQSRATGSARSGNNAGYSMTCSFG